MNTTNQNYITHLNCLIDYCLQTLRYIAMMIKLDLENEGETLRSNPILETIFTAIIDKAYISIASIFAPGKDKEEHKHIGVKQLLTEYANEFYSIKPLLDNFLSENEQIIQNIRHNRSKIIAHWDFEGHKSIEQSNGIPQHEKVTYNQMRDLVNTLLGILKRLDISDISKHNISQYEPIIYSLMQAKDGEKGYIDIWDTMGDNFIEYLNSKSI